MSSPDGGQSNAARKRARRLPAQGWKLLLILLVFVTIGPIVGTIVLGLLMAITSESLAPGAPTMVFLGLLTGMSHFIGVIPAAVSGVAVGIKQVRFGGAGWRFALIVGMLVGLAPLIFARPVTTNGAMNAAATETLFGFMVITTLATLVCWSIVRSWFLDRQGGAA